MGYRLFYMKIVIQRVKRASVTVSEELVGSIQAGLCLLVGITKDDTEKDLKALAEKVCKLKLFSDNEDGRWKYSVKDNSLSILAVSQFTLCAVTDKGSKPDFHLSMSGDLALPMFNRFVELLKEEMKECIAKDASVQTGAFGKYMNVEIINDGPVTIILDSKK